jgi:hypothetical protein
MVALSPNDRELLQQLLDDAGILSQFAAQRPAPAMIRTTFAPVLRKWIVEGDFFKARKLIRDHEAKFEITTVTDDVKLCKAGVFESWMAAFRFEDLLIGFRIAADKQSDNTPSQPKPYTAYHKASVLFNQNVFYWKKQFYTRKDVIKLHANKLGGAHLDFGRKADEIHIDEIKNYCGFEILPHTQQMLVGRDIEIARADPSRRDRVYDATELVALDTARVFADGVLASRAAVEAAIREG